MSFNKKLSLILSGIMCISTVGINNTHFNVSAGGCCSCCVSENDRKCQLWQQLIDEMQKPALDLDYDLIKLYRDRLHDEYGENYFLDVTFTYDSGETVSFDFLEYCVLQGRSSILEYLIRGYSQKHLFRTPEYYSHNPKVKERLNKVNDDGQTTLIFAAQNSESQDCSYVITSLMESNYKGEELSRYINLKDNSGNTALHYAAMRSASSLVRQLKLLYNAQLLKNNEGKTPLDIVREKINSGQCDGGSSDGPGSTMKCYYALTSSSYTEYDNKIEDEKKRINASSRQVFASVNQWMERQREASKRREERRRQKEAQEEQAARIVAAAVLMAQREYSDNDD